MVAMVESQLQVHEYLSYCFLLFYVLILSKFTKKNRENKIALAIENLIYMLFFSMKKFLHCNKIILFPCSNLLTFLYIPLLLLITFYLVLLWFVNNLNSLEVQGKNPSYLQWKNQFCIPLQGSEQYFTHTSIQGIFPCLNITDTFSVKCGRHRDVPLRSSFKEENDTHMEGMWSEVSHLL